MTKKRTDPTGFLPFSIPHVDIAGFKNSLSAAIKACPKSREQIADDMSAILRKRVSRDIIDAWTSECHAGHLPRADELAAFLLITGSTAPLAALAATIGADIIGERDAKILALEKLRRKREIVAREIADLERETQEAGL